jgi:hypothetical protein
VRDWEWGLIACAIQPLALLWSVFWPLAVIGVFGFPVALWLFLDAVGGGESA